MAIRSKILYSLAVCLLATSATYLVNGQAIGGSSAAAPLVNSLLSKQNAIPKAYSSSNSQDGVNGIKSGKFAIAVSTIPFSAAEEAGFKKLTIPQAVVTVSLFTSKVKGIQLTASQIARIFLGQITRWQQVTTKLSGTIIPVVRSDAAGVTQIYTQFLKAAYPAWPTRFVGEGPFRFGNPNTVYARGAGALATATKATNAIGWSQSGTGAYTNRLQEIQIKNKAGRFVSITAGNKADYIQALPRSPPAASATWSGVRLVNVAGAKTFPVVSLIYFFYRPSYSRAVGTKVKAFGAYTQTAKAQRLAASFFFYPLPGAYTTRGAAAIKSIKLT